MNLRKTNELKAVLGKSRFDAIHNIFENAARSYPLHKTFLARSYPLNKNFLDLKDIDLTHLALSKEDKVRKAFRFLKAIADIKQTHPLQTLPSKIPADIVRALNNITQEAHNGSEELAKATMALILMEFKRVSTMMEKELIRHMESLYRQIAYDIDAKVYAEAQVFAFSDSPRTKRKNEVSDSPAAPDQLLSSSTQVIKSLISQDSLPTIPEDEKEDEETPSIEAKMESGVTLTPSPSPEIPRLSERTSTDAPVGPISKVLEKQKSKSQLFSTKTEAVGQSSTGTASKVSLGSSL